MRHWIFQIKIKIRFFHFSCFWFDVFVLAIFGYVSNNSLFSLNIHSIISLWPPSLSRSCCSTVGRCSTVDHIEFSFLFLVKTKLNQFLSTSIEKHWTIFVLFVCYLFVFFLMLCVYRFVFSLIFIRFQKRFLSLA